jgi:predicted secreted protein
MATQALSAYGTLLKRGDSGAPETFTTVPEVRSISGPSTETDEAEVTSHSSAAAGAYREFILTLIDAGSIEFDMNYVPSDAVHQNLRSDFTSRTKRNWQLVLPGNAQTISFSGYVKTFSLEFPTDDAVTASVSIRLTGAVTFS